MNRTLADLEKSLIAARNGTEIYDEAARCHVEVAEDFLLLAKETPNDVETVEDTRRAVTRAIRAIKTANTASNSLRSSEAKLSGEMVDRIAYTGENSGLLRRSQRDMEALKKTRRARAQLEAELEKQRREEERLGQIVAEREKMKKKIQKYATMEKKRFDSKLSAASKNAGDFEADVRSHSREKLLARIRNAALKFEKKRNGGNKQSLRNSAKGWTKSLFRNLDENKTEIQEFVKYENEFERERDRVSKRQEKRAQENEIVTRRRASLIRNITRASEDMRIEAKRTVSESFGNDPIVAVKTGRVDAVRAFCVADGSTSRVLNFRCRSSGRTLLHYAALWGCVDVTEFLLDIGANVDAVDTAYRRFTPLLEAARGGHLALCKLLLCSGNASVRSRDFQGNTVMHWASRCGHGFLFLRLMEWCRPTERSGLLQIVNDRRRTARDVARVAAVRELFDEAVHVHKRRSGRRSNTRERLHRGIRKALAVSTQKRTLWSSRGKRERDRL